MSFPRYENYKDSDSSMLEFSVSQINEYNIDGYFAIYLKKEAR